MERKAPKSDGSRFLPMFKRAILGWRTPKRTAGYHVADLIYPTYSIADADSRFHLGTGIVRGQVLWAVYNIIISSIPSSSMPQGSITQLLNYHS